MGEPEVRKEPSGRGSPALSSGVLLSFAASLLPERETP